MSLIEEVAEDLGGVRLAQPQIHADDPRGTKFGKTWVDDGAPIRVVRRKASATERFNMGMQVTAQVYMLYTDLPNGVPPLTERQRVVMDGVDLDVKSVVPVEEPGEEGCIVTAEVV